MPVAAVVAEASRGGCDVPTKLASPQFAALVRAIVAGIRCFRNLPKWHCRGLLSPRRSMPSYPCLRRTIGPSRAWRVTGRSRSMRTHQPAQDSADTPAVAIDLRAGADRLRALGCIAGEDVTARGGAPSVAVPTSRSACVPASIFFTAPKARTEKESCPRPLGRAGHSKHDGAREMVALFKSSRLRSLLSPLCWTVRALPLSGQPFAPSFPITDVLAP